MNLNRISPKKKKNSGMELTTYQSQIGKGHVVNLVFWQNGLDKQETSIWRNIKTRIVNLAKIRRISQTPYFQRYSDKYRCCVAVRAIADDPKKEKA
jgi:hypothetical protein